MRAALALLLAALPAGQAFAADPPAVAAATPPVDAAALSAARRLVAASDLEKQLRALVPQMVDAAMAQARSTFKANALPEGLKLQLDAALREGVASMMGVFTPAVQDQMAQVYARRFSSGDLNHLADMMSDPVMVRFRDGMPGVMHDLLPMLMAAMQPRQQAFQKQILTIIGDWLRTHPDDRSRLARPVAS